MRRSLESRIRKLEAISQARVASTIVFRYGRVSRLANDAVGERHIAIVTSAATALPNVEHCDFEERVGPADVGDELAFLVYLSSDSVSVPEIAIKSPERTTKQL
jgi:hypothetical protein